MSPKPIHDAKSLRHKWEMPLIWTSAIVTLIALCAGLWILSMEDREMAALFGDNAETVSEYALYTLMLFILPLIYFVYRFYLAAKAKSNGVRVGPQQFPELWAMYQSLGQRLDMPHLPRLYVTNGNGVVNAYALSCNKRNNYIVLHSETVMHMAQNPDMVEFVLAHEMAHHKLGHVALWRLLIGFIPQMLVPLGISTTRAQEYSADRVALKACGHHGSAMSLLAVGPWMADQVNHDAWRAQCEAEKDEYLVRLANIMSDHAVMSKRFKALVDIEQHGFGRHGDMF